MKSGLYAENYCQSTESIHLFFESVLYRKLRNFNLLEWEFRLEIIRQKTVPSSREPHRSYYEG